MVHMKQVTQTGCQFSSGPWAEFDVYKCLVDILIFYPSGDWTAPPASVLLQVKYRKSNLCRRHFTEELQYILHTMYYFCNYLVVHLSVRLYLFQPDKSPVFSLRHVPRQTIYFYTFVAIMHRHFAGGIKQCCCPSICLSVCQV